MQPVPALVIAGGVPSEDMDPQLESADMVKRLPKATTQYVEISDATHFSFMSICKPGGMALIHGITAGGVDNTQLGAGMGERFDKRKVAALCMLSHAIGLLFLTFSTHLAELVAFAVFHGLAWGLRGPLMQAIRADYFGVGALGAIKGI